MASHKLYIDINLAPIVDEFSITEKHSRLLTKKVVNDVTNLIYRNWSAAAANGLRSTRREYVDGLRIIDEGVMSNRIVLMGTLPNMIESGASAFDMKDGFEKSTKIKKNKNGDWYLHVPFRHATPDSIGENSVFSSVMPREIYEAVKNTVERTISGSGKGLKAINIPDSQKSQTQRSAISDEKLGGKSAEYIHKNNMYEGITRSSKTYESATQSKYVSFRTVGKNSDFNAFIHRGFKAYDFANRALQISDIDTQTNNSIDEFLSNLGL